MDYASVRLLHISCASISITLFMLRGALQFSGIDWRRWRALRILPHVNDTILLGAAIALSLMSRQYPVAQNWLSAKVLALLVYIVIGGVALRAAAGAGAGICRGAGHRGLHRRGRGQPHGQPGAVVKQLRRGAAASVVQENWTV